MFVFAIFVRALPRISTSARKKTVFSHLKYTIYVTIAHTKNVIQLIGRNKKNK